MMDFDELRDYWAYKFKIGVPGDPGAVFIPRVDEEGNLSWRNNGGLPNPAARNIRGPQGEKGEALAYDELTPAQREALRGPEGPRGLQGSPGATFTPHVDAAGNLSWENDGGLPNPPAQNIRGPKGADGADADEVLFTAEYGVTAQAALDEAYNAGRQLLVRRGGIFLPLSGTAVYTPIPGRDGPRVYWFSSYNPAAGSYEVCTYDSRGWTVRTVSIPRAEDYVAKAQGASNAGRFLVVGADGDVTLAEIAGAGGVSF